MALVNDTLYFAVPSEHAPALQNTAFTLGASVATVLDAVSKVDIVVCDDFLEQNWYLDALKLDKLPLCVTRSWLTACSESKSRVDPKSYQLRGLEGLVISITGLGDARERQAVSNRVTSLGAKFSADLSRLCTHLVLYGAALSKKAQYAQQWNQHIVKPCWLDACYKAKFRQDERLHRPESLGPIEGDKKAQQQGATRPQTTTAAAAARITQPGQGSTGTVAAAAAAASKPQSDCNEPSKEQTVSASRPASSNADNTATEAAADGSRVDLQRERSLKDTSLDRDQDVNTKHETKHIDDEESLFMDWVHFHVVGATSDEALLTRKLVSQCGAIREVNLSSRVTHIIIGSETSAADMNAVRAHATNWKDHTRVVKLQWLQDCVTQHVCKEPVDPVYLVQLQQPQQQQLGGVLRSSSSITGLDGLDGGGGSNSLAGLLGPVTATVDFLDLAGSDAAGGQRSRHGFPNTAAGGGAGGGGAGISAALFQEHGLPRGQCLKDLWFTMAAVPQDKELAALVRQHGGQVFTADSVRKVKDVSKAFAVCPHGINSYAVQELERTSSSFRHVVQGHRVTAHWLEDVTQKCKLLDPFNANMPSYRPLPFDVPVNQLEAAKVHIAGFARHQAQLKKGVGRILQVLGATVTDNLTPENTHLVLPEAGTQKYLLAVRTGAVPINEQWVLHIARNGRVPDPWDYRFRPAQESSEQRKTACQRVHERQSGKLDLRVAIGAAQHTTANNSLSGEAQAPGAGGGGGASNMTGMRSASHAAQIQHQGGHPQQTVQGVGGGAAPPGLHATEAGCPATILPLDMGPTQFNMSQQQQPPQQCGGENVSEYGEDHRKIPQQEAEHNMPTSTNNSTVVGKTVSYSAASGFKLMSLSTSKEPTRSQQQQTSQQLDPVHKAQQAQVQQQTAHAQADACDQAASATANFSNGALITTAQAPTTNARRAGLLKPLLDSMQAQQPDALPTTHDTAAAAPDAAPPEAAAVPLMGSAGDEDWMDVENSIQALITDKSGHRHHQEVAFSQLEGVLLPPAPGVSVAAAAAGGLPHVLSVTGTGGEASRGSGGSSAALGSMVPVSGGDVSSKSMLPPRRTSKRQASRDVAGKGTTDKDQHQDNMMRDDLMEMSQQVGYDAGQRPDEKLLRKRATRASTTIATKEDDQAKQQFIARVLRTRPPAA